MLSALTIPALALFGLRDCSVMNSCRSCRRLARGFVRCIARLDERLLQGCKFGDGLDERRLLKEDRGRRNLDLHTPLKDIGIAKKCHRQPQRVEESLMDCGTKGAKRCGEVQFAVIFGRIWRDIAPQQARSGLFRSITCRLGRKARRLIRGPAARLSGAPLL